MLGRASQIKGKCTPPLWKMHSNPLKRSVVHNFNSSKRCLSKFPNPLSTFSTPQKDQLSTCLLNSPKTWSNTILTPPKDCLGTFSTPEKGQWSTCPRPTLLKNWLIGDEEVEEWVKEWIPYSTVNTTLGKFFYILHFACFYSEGLLKNILAKHLCCISGRWW